MVTPLTEPGVLLHQNGTLLERSINPFWRSQGGRAPQSHAPAGWDDPPFGVLFHFGFGVGGGKGEVGRVFGEIGEMAYHNPRLRPAEGVSAWRASIATHAWTGDSERKTFAETCQVLPSADLESTPIFLMILYLISDILLLLKNVV